MYRAAGGETFADIARRFYGDETQAGRIRRANPGVYEPLRAGVTVAVPTAPQPGLTQAPKTADEVGITIDGEHFDRWTQVTITRAVDSVSTVAAVTPFDHTDPTQARQLRPFSYAPVTVHVGGHKVITGTLIDTSPSATDSAATVAVTAYGRPGVLSDCGPPISAYPLEYFSATLEDVAREVCEPFGIRTKFKTPPGAVFEMVELSPGQPVFPFLANLARQRGLLMADNPDGDLVFQTMADSPPVAQLTDGAPPVIKVSAAFKPRGYYSVLTGLSSNIVGIQADQYTVRNPRLAGITRPHTFLVPDSFEGDMVAAVVSNTARMFGDVASYTVEVAGWHDASGNLWEPGAVVTLNAPRVMVYRPYDFMIRQVELEYRGDRRTARLTLVPPSVYNNEPPRSLPWDI